MASNLITSSHPRAFHAPENGGCGKFQSVILYRPLLSGHKKSNLRKQTIFCGKNLFQNIKEHFGQCFLIKSGVIMIGVFSAFVYPILMFFLLCRHLQDNKIQKLEKGTFSGLTRLSRL